MTDAASTAASHVEALKERVCAEVDRIADRLVDASHRIHEHPELNFEEVFAHDLLTSIIDDAGLAPTRHAYGVGTAFEARAGSDGAEIACCASTTRCRASATRAGTT
jgi:metal-dependent amidase/aminoacylase/carboxypeptidase family protein